MVLQFLLQKDASARESLERNFKRSRTSDQSDVDPASIEESDFGEENWSLQPQVEALLELRRRSVNFGLEGSPVPLQTQPDFSSFNLSSSTGPQIDHDFTLTPLQPASDQNFYQYPTQAQFQSFDSDQPIPSSSGLSYQPAYYPLPPIHASENHYSCFSPPSDPNTLHFDLPSTISPEVPPGFSANTFDFNFPYDGTGLFSEGEGSICGYGNI